MQCQNTLEDQHSRRIKSGGLGLTLMVGERINWDVAFLSIYSVSQTKANESKTLMSE